MTNIAQRFRRSSTMLLAEWRHLSTNKTLLVAATALLFVPLLYAAIFLSSVWDPYGHTDRLPIAFVNNDTGAHLGDKQLTIGKNIETSLKQNSSIGWEFVSKQQADDGMRRGYYYAMVEIPKDFSTRAASLTSDQPQQATVHYTVTPAKNYIGAIISRQAASKVTSNVSQQITSAYAKEIMAGIGELGDGLTQASQGSERLNSGATKLSQGLVRYTSGVQLLAENQQKLGSGLDQLHNGATQLSNGLDKLQTSLPTDQQIAQLTAGMAQIQRGMQALNSGVQQPSATVVTQQAKVTSSAQALIELLQSLQASMATAQAVLQRTTAQATAAGGSTTITLSELQTLANALQRAGQAAQQSQTLLTDLQSLTSTLTAQQATLEANTATLTNGVNQFVPQATAAFGGYTVLRNATTQLQTGAAQLTNGSLAAQRGNAQLSSGATTLSANSSTLVDASTQIASGTSTLTQKLKNGAAQVTLLPTSQAAQQQIAAPATAQETTNGDVPNYGYAMAPYMLSLALFVGGLAFTSMYPVRKPFARPEKARRWWLAKMSVLSLAALLQAGLMILIVMTWVGLQPDHVWQFVSATCLASLTFMSVIALLIMVFDNPGRLLVMILMVLQLAASEGIFPLQTTDQFYQIINPWLPMTHSIIALREAISGGISGTIYWQHMGYLALFALIANLLLLGFLAWRGKRIPTHTVVDGDS